MAKDKLGIYVTDTSFHKATKISSIAILDIENNKCINIQKETKSPKEGETIGIMESLRGGIGKYKNIIIFCDNRYSVEEARRLVFKSNYWFSKYNYIQIVWLPRENNYLADYFSRNIGNKEDSINSKINQFKNGHKTTNILSIVLTKSDKIKILEEIRDSLSINVLEIVRDTVKSKSMINFFYDNNFSYKEISNSEIDLIKLDLKKLYYIDPELIKNGSDLYKIFNGLISINL